MDRPLLLLLDPIGSRRANFARVLKVDFEVLTPRSMKTVKELVREQCPDVVLASMRQHRGHGLEICTRLRRLEGGDGLFVVHGAPLQGLSMAELRTEMGRTWKVDHWLSNDASPPLVALTLKQLLKDRRASISQRRHRRPERARASLSGRNPTVSASPVSLKTTGSFEVEPIRPPTEELEG